MKAWQLFLKRLEQELGQETINRWLHTLEVTDFDAGNIYLKASDAFHVSWFEEHIRPLARKYLFNENHRPVRIHLSQAKESTPKKSREKKEPSSIKESPLDPFALFATFIATEGSKIAVDLLQKITGSTNVEYNPLFLFGPPSSGKTHLLMAIAHHYKKQNANIRYVHTDSFTSHLVDAIRFGNMKHFRQTYRSCDILLIDDVHLLANRLSTQEEFFHTFNFLHMSGKQIILSSKLSARELEGIEERLISRFEWGLPLSLSLPTDSEKKAILLERCASRKIDLSPAILDFILDRFRSSPGAMIRALDAIVLHHHLYSSSLTTEQVEKILSPLLEEERRLCFTPEMILRTVASYFSLSSEELKSKSKEKEKVYPRQIAMFLLREKLLLPYQQIGKVFHRDHSTVMTSIRAIEAKTAQREETLYKDLSQIERDFKKILEIKNSD